MEVRRTPLVRVSSGSDHAAVVGGGRVGHDGDMKPENRPSSTRSSGRRRPVVAPEPVRVHALHACLDVAGGVLARMRVLGGLAEGGVGEGDAGATGNVVEHDGQVDNVERRHPRGPRRPSWEGRL